MARVTLAIAQHQIAVLKEEVSAECKRADANADGIREWKKIAEEREKSLTEARKQFDDLKQRLHAADTANQFMRGYLARLQEDDVVREELVETGDPDGERQMVPKRKHTPFPRPTDFTTFEGDARTMGYVERERRKPKHWITY